MDLFGFREIDQRQKNNILIYNLVSRYYERGRNYERSNSLLL